MHSTSEPMAPPSAVQMSTPTPATEAAASPYTDTELPPDAKTDLAVLVHFLLLFRKALDIPTYALLRDAPEKSLLSQSGEPFTAFMAFLASASKKSVATLQEKVSGLPSPAARLALLRDLADKYAHHPDLRPLTMAENGRVIPSARLRTGARDSSSSAYVWLRGPDGCCSDRIVAAAASRSARVLRTPEVLDVVAALEGGSRRRADLLAAAWLRERVERSAARTRRVERAEEERVRIERELEEERKLKVERARKRAGLVGGAEVDTLKCGRGRRERKIVCYEEEEVDELMEEEDDAGDPEEADEFVIDSEEEGDGDSQDESDKDSQAETDIGDPEEGTDEAWASQPAALGRQRVVSGGRLTRSRAKEEENMEQGRPVRKCRLVQRSSYE